MNDSPRFLIVDDEPALQRIESRVLKKGGFECRVASSAEEAIRILQNEEIDVMLTDIVMPGLDGLHLARVAQERYPRVVVVMVTGRTDTASLSDALQAGVVDFVAKPFRQDDLIAAAARAIHMRSGRTRPGTRPRGPVEAQHPIDLDTVFTQMH